MNISNLASQLYTKLYVPSNIDKISVIPQLGAVHAAVLTHEGAVVPDGVSLHVEQLQPFPVTLSKILQMRNSFIELYPFRI